MKDKTNPTPKIPSFWDDQIDYLKHKEKSLCDVEKNK